MASLDGAEALETVGDSLYVQYNDALTDASGILGVSSIGGDLAVTGNGELPTTETDAILAALSPFVAGSVDVSDNGE